VTAADAAPTPEPPPLHRNRDFLLLWSGQAISVLGSRVSSIAYPLLVLALTHSPARTGVAGFASTLPYLLFQLPAGVWLDRWNRRRAMMISDLVRAIALGSIGVAWLAGTLTFGQIAVVGFVEGSMFVIASVAEPAAVAHVVPAQQLPTALAQNEARVRGAMLLGQPLGGLLFGIGEAIPFLVDAVSYVASLATLRAIRSDFGGGERATFHGRSAWGEMLEGLGWLWRNPLLRDAAWLVAVSNLVFQAGYLVVIVLAQRKGASPTQIGLIVAGTGVGGVAGSLIAPSVQRRVQPRWVVIGCNWIWALLFPLFAVAPGPLALGAVWAAAAFVGPVWNVVLGTYAIVLVPEALRARVASAELQLAYGAIPIGSLFAAVLLARLSPAAAMSVLAGVMLVTAIVATADPAVRAAPALHDDR
jgi:predicted MFS family arabinose efflux permease